MSDSGLTLFLVDDDAAIRSSLSRSLRRRGYLVESLASASEFLKIASPELDGVLLLDYGMPGMNGLELQAWLNDTGIRLPVIFITGHGGVPESVQAIKGGAVDFLEKPFHPKVLIDRIEIALTLATELRARREGRRETRARFGRLTLREMEIVSHMVANPSATSSKEVGAFLGISPRTVDHHRARILEKLQIRSVPELIALAGKTGTETG